MKCITPTGRKMSKTKKTAAAAAPKTSYADLAVEAITTLKERTGSSLQAIKAFIASKHPEVDFQAVSYFVDNISYFIQ